MTGYENNNIDKAGILGDFFLFIQCRTGYCFRTNMVTVFFCHQIDIAVDSSRHLIWYIMTNMKTTTIIKNLRRYHLQEIYSVDVEVWSKLAKRARIKACVLRQNCGAILAATGSLIVTAFSHCGTLTHCLLLQIISYSSTKVSSCYGM